MSPAALFPLALITPILLAISFFVPVYAGVLGATWIIYDTGTDPHPLAERWYDVFYILDAYMQLFNYWLANISAMDLLTYTLPVLVLPFGGLLLSLWLTVKIATSLLNTFQLSTS